MKKFIGWTLAILLVIAAGAFVFYKYYLPGMVAEALVTDEQPAYMPAFVHSKIKRYKAPVNKGAGDVIEQIHKSNVTLEQILEAIDNTEEEQVHAMIAELNQVEVKNTNEVFDLAKKHFHTDFDIEILRAPFNKNVDMPMIRKGLAQARIQQTKDEAMDPDMAKEVIKQILRQKEQEYNKAMNIK